MSSIAENQKAPRFANIATFFRSKYSPEPRDWKELDIALVGVPYDGGSTNRPGARTGPRGVREMSTNLAPWSPSLDVNPFLRCNIADVGDAWVSKPFDLEPSLAQIQDFYEGLHAAGVTPISIGGDHSVSLPILRAVAADGPIAMLHIDAHCDTGMGYMGSKYHHGAPFSRAVEENLLDPCRVVQIGIRGPLNDSSIWAFSVDSGMRVITMDEFCRRSITAVISEVRQIVGNGPCYLSLDIDALDPAFAPGTGTPVAGGFTVREAQQIIRGVRGLNLIGADVVEVADILDPSRVTSLNAASLLHDVLCIAVDAYK